MLARLVFLLHSLLRVWCWIYFLFSLTPVRGSTHFFCCAKKSKQKKALHTANPKCPSTAFQRSGPKGSVHCQPPRQLNTNRSGPLLPPLRHQCRKTIMGIEACFHRPNSVARTYFATVGTMSRKSTQLDSARSPRTPTTRAPVAKRGGDVWWRSVVETRAEAIGVQPRLEVGMAWSLSDHSVVTL
jgi:hypothetical protein